jgi:hypothetical protein
LNKFVNAGKNVRVSHALPSDLFGAARKDPVLVIEATSFAGGNQPGKGQALKRVS